VCQEAKKERTVVDKVFFARILKIVKIMVPGVFCKEVKALLQT
jgi:hypothetical protein